MLDDLITVRDLSVVGGSLYARDLTRQDSRAVAMDEILGTVFEYTVTAP